MTPSDGDAIKSEAGSYRDRLVRELGGLRTLCVGMQNPSKAEADDPTVNDPTILRLMGFTTRLGFGRLVVVNARRYRATDPADMYRWLAGLSVDEAARHHAQSLDIAIREARAADMFIAAWGNGHDQDYWPIRFRDGLISAGIDLYAFGLNANGTPKHPLARGKNRIPDDAAPILWQSGSPSRPTPPTEGGAS